MELIVAQILGGIALILVCISYFLKSKAGFLVLEAVADFFYASAFMVVGAYVGGIITIICVFRCIYIYFAEKNEFKYTIHFLFVFVVLYVVSTAVFWQGALDIIPLITGTIYTFAYAIKNLQVMRYVLIVPNILLIIYNIMSTTYVSAVLDFIEVVVLIIAIIKFAKGIRAKKQTLN